MSKTKSDLILYCWCPVEIRDLLNGGMSAQPIGLSFA